ncbi:MAG: hypothetical protein R3C55_08910 [Parvularculaceae bacterium]
MEIVPEGDSLQVAAHFHATLTVSQLDRHDDPLHRIQHTPHAGRPRRRQDGVGRRNDGLQVSGSRHLALIDLPNRDELSKEFAERPGTLAPGMPAESYIRTGKRPAISYFLKPLTDAFSRSMRDE